MYISLSLLIISCNKNSVEVFPTVDLGDTTLILRYKNNTKEKIVTNKIASLYSNYKLNNPAYENSIEEINLYERQIWLKDIAPYTKEYTEIMKKNFDYAYTAFPNFRDTIPNYLTSMLAIHDPITIIDGKSFTTKTYKIKDFQSNDKKFQLLIKDNNQPYPLRVEGMVLYTGEIFIHPIKISK